jgi:hypothetical protein
MPLQNRVTPTGEIVAVASRGLLMGNRGILHDAAKRLGRSRWKHKVWIICRIRFRGRHREVMTPHRYTELFFLDEAVALAAGHRPCFECRRQEFHAWQRAWQAGNGTADIPRAGEMDSVLHGERIVSGTRRQRTWRCPLAGLPDAAFVLWDDRPHIVIGGRLRCWSHDGYGAAVSGPGREPVTVLTPRHSVGALRGGYRPILHSSAGTAWG